MPIPVLNFPIHTFEQANPELMAAGYTSDLLGKAIENQKRMLAAKYLPSQLDEQLKQLQLNTEILRPQAQYAPQFTQASLAEALMKAPRARAEIERIYQGQIPMEQAHAKYFGAQSALIPEELEHKRNVLEWQKNKFNNPNIMQFARAISTLPAAQRAAFIAEHPEYEDLLLNIGNQIAGNTPGLINKNPNLGQGLGLGLGLGSGYPQQGTNISEAVETMPDYSNIEQNKSNFFNVYPHGREKLILNNKLAANNAQLTPATKKMADNAVIMDKWLFDNREEYSKRLINAAKYAGVQGQSKKAADALAKTNPEIYQDYKWVKNNFSPNMGNKIRLMEGMGATDQQTKILDNMINSINWDVNPKQAIELANRVLGDMASMSNSVIQVAEPMYPGVRRNLARLPEYTPGESYINTKNKSGANNKFSQEDLEYTAKKHGISIEEVKKRLGV